MWDKEMWESMPNVHKYIKTCEISIDAGTKDTYENRTRLGGNWNTLIENLKFINTIPKLKTIKTSFVVQDTNYMEMSEFYNIIRNIFGVKSQIFFGKITNWGTYSDSEFVVKKIWDFSHPEHAKFVKEFNKVCKNNGVFHNMYEFINTKKTLI
jgi:MoaA/NifB/PqqE/SkfB family radical SAM enzyme